MSAVADAAIQNGLTICYDLRFPELLRVPASIAAPRPRSGAVGFHPAPPAGPLETLPRPGRENQAICSGGQSRLFAAPSYDLLGPDDRRSRGGAGPKRRRGGLPGAELESQQQARSCRRR